MSYSEELLGLQNPDGGWGYRRGGSWTEPTCHALLGLAAEGKLRSPAFARAASWLKRCQRPDGGFAPKESIDESTWVSALVLLLPAEALIPIDRAAALRWVTAQTGKEAGWVARLRMWMLGQSSQQSITFDGWPWYSGTAAWVAPTAFSILALERAGGERERIQQGKSFLLSRHCRDGGWNHGSTRALGYDSDSYPETTGLALLALHGETGAEIEGGLNRAEEHVKAAHSREAGDWLQLGLLAHGRKPSVSKGEPRRSATGLALAAIADAAREGRNVFLS